MYSPNPTPEPKKRSPGKDGVILRDDDEELIAYFQEQRKSTRSREWAACLDAVILDLQK